MKHNIMFFKFTNEKFTQNIQFKNHEEYLLIDNTKTLYFIVDIMNFDKQENDTLRATRFISYIAALSIYNFFNKKVEYDESLTNYYMLPESVTRDRHLSATTLLKTMTEDTEKLSKLLYKYNDVFINDKPSYNIVYDDFYNNKCDKNNIKNFVKITIDYQLDYNTTEDIVNNIVYEHVLIEY